VTIAIDGVEYDTIKIPLDGVEQEPAVQHLKALRKELSFPRIDRLRSILRAGWGLVTEVGCGGRTAVFTDSLEELILVYRPVAAGDTAPVTQQLSADEVRAYALKMLRVLYEGTGADVRKRVNIAKLADALGLTELAPGSGWYKIAGSQPVSVSRTALRLNQRKRPAGWPTGLELRDIPAQARRVIASLS
jgi:hypothetical protein